MAFSKNMILLVLIYHIKESRLKEYSVAKIIKRYDCYPKTPETGLTSYNGQVHEKVVFQHFFHL